MRYFGSGHGRIEGHDDLPVDFATNSIVAVTGLYDNNQQRYVVLAGTTAGKVHEIYWKDDTVGIEGHDDLPVTFTPGSIVAVTALYDGDQHEYVVVVGTTEDIYTRSSGSPTLSGLKVTTTYLSISTRDRSLPYRDSTITIGNGLLSR